ncbi:hypothetical protein [Streptomyces sp. NBC_01237]|uniref:hypothetical protein n=1 Tax=Streptomyces sp. NBC_01237 TaxID=2903790 RepID=UPI002DD921F1|nr:hypothetical protein [Streptomyces sp. NBC_01237]WRZ76592.1 hypothetical protein OG251_36005 [Streptomyces sp. NBC_01237]
MIRLPSNHAAVTAPLVASSTRFPGIPIGRSLLDGRPFHLSPVLVDDSVLPSTNSLALGGLGSGKSTTAKTCIHREILHRDHQAVVVDSFGEGADGEWAALARSLGGRVIKAGDFTLNPLSPLFPPQVREQLVRSLILAVEPGALTPQATHALQHALNHPKSASLNGLVDALACPEDGRWPAATLADWGVGAAIALSRYTEGSLRGLFDGEGASLPPTDLPILSFDFSGLDRNSPAIPSLMAAVSCWAEQVWLPQSTAVHRHLVIEEAWQILLSPATGELIQRLLKNSRRAGLSLKAIMHTLSDLGTGKAQDLAKLCEIAHVGRLGPEEAALTGALLGLPQWAIDMIPTLGPGQAVWRVGPDYVDIIQTTLTDDEAALTDTSSRRRTAQQAQAPAVEQAPADDAEPDITTGAEAEADIEETSPVPAEPDTGTGSDDEDQVDGGGEWAWDMPPNVVDIRHHDALQAAREGRCAEAADLAALGERADIAAHGINSTEAVAWISTRALVAELCGNPDQAVRLRATVARMGNHHPETTVNYEPQQQAKLSPDQDPEGPEDPTAASLRRLWPAAAAIVGLSLAIAFVWATPGGEEKQRQERQQHQQSQERQERQEREEKAARYQGKVPVALVIDGIHVNLVGRWDAAKKRTVLSLRARWDQHAQFLRMDVGDETVSSVRSKDTEPMRSPELVLPVDDPRADITVRVAVGGKHYKQNSRSPSREIRLSPATGTAFDARTGKKFPEVTVF